MLEITGVVLGIIIALYLISLALWELVVLLSNLAGLIIYFMYKQNSNICYGCGAMQNKDNKFCVKCGAQIGRACDKRGNDLGRNDNYCDKCGSKI